MSDIPSSSSSAKVRASLEITDGVNEQQKIILRNGRGSSVEVYLYGAQVTSWKNERGEEMLFLSKKAIFDPPKPIRGGIPLGFPQFSNLGPLDAHGFVRNRMWTVDTKPPPFPASDPNKSFIDFILKPTESDLKIWPHSFEFRQRIILEPTGDLTMIAKIRNTNKDGKPFKFTFAYHNYFSVSDISEIRIEGLETMYYFDNLKGREKFTEQGNAVTFEEEVDKTYISTPAKIAVVDHEKNQTYVIRKIGLPDAVVWNPWDRKSRQIADLGNDDYKKMVCVEPAAIENPIKLKVGEEWEGKQILTCVPSSYCSMPPRNR